MARWAQRLRALDPIVAVAVAVIAIGAAQLFAGALSSGVTTDEPIEADEARSWVEHGWYLPGELLVDGRPDPANEFAIPFVYGPAFAAVSHAANVVVGNEAGDEISHSAGSYAIRHLISALLGALAVGAVGAAVWLFTRSRRFALWAAAGLLAIPVWTGQSFFNPKDIPAGCGYTLVTVALALALWEDPGAPAGRRRRLAIAALLAGGLLIGAGTRLSLLVPLLLSLLAYAALRLGQWRLGGIVRAIDTDLAVAAGAGVGLAAIAVLYPNVAETPLELLTESVSSSAGYPYEGVTLTAGELLAEHPPWWYLPAWVGASYPLLLGGLTVLGAWLGIRALARMWGGGRGELWRSRQLGLVLVLQQALMLPLGAVLTGAVIYNGMRQHLYVLPALAILAGVGAAGLWGWARRRRPERRWRRLAAAVLALALLAPTAEQLLLFPYNYAYISPVAQLGGYDDRWESDYWYASGREAVAHVPRGADLLCSYLLVLPWDTDGRPELEPCDDDQVAPFLDEQGDEAGGQPAGDGSTVWVIARKRAGNRAPDYCEEAGDVTRRLRGEEVTMAFVLRCDAEQARLDTVR